MMMMMLHVMLCVCSDESLPDMHFVDGGPLTAQYLLVLDALNFCFWPGIKLQPILPQSIGTLQIIIIILFRRNSSEEMTGTSAADYEFA